MKRDKFLFAGAKVSPSLLASDEAKASTSGRELLFSFAPARSGDAGKMASLPFASATLAGAKVGHMPHSIM